MRRIEGENRIDMAAVVNWLAEKYNVPDRTALRWLCTVISYNVVTEAITEQIDYLLGEKVFQKP